VAQQRLPDLSSVSTADFDQYLTFYQSFNTDIIYHYNRLLKLLEKSKKLQELISAPYIVATNQDALANILKLKEEVSLYSQKLYAFSDVWRSYNELIDRLEVWIARSEKELKQIEIPQDPSTEPIEKMREFWEIKAQYEVYKDMHDDANIYFENSLKTISVADDSLQRQFNSQVEERWQNITEQIRYIQDRITNGLTDSETSNDEKVKLLENELQEIKLLMSIPKEVIKTQEELSLHIERLEILKFRITSVSSELGRLGLQEPKSGTQKVSELFAITRSLALQVDEELELSYLMKDRLTMIKTGIVQAKLNQQRIDTVLNDCKMAEQQDYATIEQALIDCQATNDDLAVQWQDIMQLRQLLHTLPVTSKIFVSPVQLERELSAVQDNHSVLEKKFEDTYTLLKNRLTQWRQYEQQLEMVHQHVRETEYMIDVLQVRDQVNLKRLSKAADRLEVSSWSSKTKKIL
jgi:nesprin-1